MRRTQAIGAVLGAGLFACGACSSGTSSDAGHAGTATGGASGNTSGNAGRGGSASGSGGSPGKAGASGKAGSSGNGGGSSSVAGSSVGGSSDGGEGGEGGSVGNPCTACASGLCLPDGQCVDCLPANDQCAAGQYCSPDSYSCVPGCKDADSCASGVCDAVHDCQHCIADSECSAGHVCGAGVCGAPCSAAEEGNNLGCSGTLTCCGLHCIDQKTDSKHCGACGTACATGQFCGLNACRDSALSQVCSVARITVVLDGQDGNQTPARSMAAGLSATCLPSPTVREVSQDVADAVNTANGRPVAGGGELLIAAGGTFFAHLTAYVSSQPVSPVYSNFENDTLQYRKRSDASIVASAPYSADHDSQDFFVLQFMRDPASGSLILNAQGFWQSGTTAAAFYFNQAMLPALSTFGKSWYVYKWTDANADMMPDLNEITLIDSGS